MAYESVKSGLRDVGFTLPTPFEGDGSEVNHDALTNNLEYLVDAGAGLYIPCGNTGEYYSLSDEERIAVTRTTVEATRDIDVVVAGASGSIPHVTSLAKEYDAVGADAVMIMTPPHPYTHERGLVEYYRDIIDSIDIPIVIYIRSGIISKRVLNAITEEPEVVGVKYALGEIAQFSSTVRDVSGDVVWLNGLAERYTPAFALEGAEGFTTGIGNFLPKQALALHDAVKNGDWSRATVLCDQLRALEEIRDGTGEENRNASANNVPVVKHGMDLIGLEGGVSRPPITDLPAEDKDRVEAIYNHLE